MKLQAKLLLTLVSLIFAFGCGSGNDSLAPVSGTVLMDGKPLAKVKVDFMPKNGGRPASALTDENGKFSNAGTFTMGDGAPIGDSWVVVTSIGAPPMGGEIAMDGKKLKGASADYNASIPLIYGKPKESGLSATISRGSDNNFTFKLDSTFK
jgi:hypothetical protein